MKVVGGLIGIFMPDYHDSDMAYMSVHSMHIKGFQIYYHCFVFRAAVSMHPQLWLQWVIWWLTIILSILKTREAKSVLLVLHMQRKPKKLRFFVVKWQELSIIWWKKIILLYCNNIPLNDYLCRYKCVVKSIFFIDIHTISIHNKV